MTECLIGMNPGLTPIQNINEINISKLCNINMHAFTQTLFAMKFWVLAIVAVTIIEFITSTLSRAASGKKIFRKEINADKKWIKIDERMREISLLVRLIAGLNLLEMVINYVGIL